jgi:hypothetical protein
MRLFDINWLLFLSVMIQKKITNQTEFKGIPGSVPLAKTNHNQFPVVEIGNPGGGHKALVQFLGKYACLQRHSL